jgi:hypothetical protein
LAGLEEALKMAGPLDGNIPLPPVPDASALSLQLQNSFY